jgi:hypothetical protein
MLSHDEKKRLETVEADSWYLRPTNARMIEYCAKIFARHIRGGRVLELGPAEGLMSLHLAVLADHLTLVDGAEIFCEPLSLLHNLESDLKTHVSVDHVVRKC